MFQLIYVGYPEAVAEGDIAVDEGRMRTGTHLMAVDLEDGE